MFVLHKRIINYPHAYSGASWSCVWVMLFELSEIAGTGMMLVMLNAKIPKFSDIK